MTRRPAARSAAQSRKSASAKPGKPAADRASVEPGKPAADRKRPARAATAAGSRAQRTRPGTTQPGTTQPGTTRPGALRVAACVQALEAVGMCVATVYSAAATINGKSYQTASGIALTLIAFGTAIAFALIALGIARANPWSRTPALLTQLFAGGLGIYVVGVSRPEWGVPMLILAAAGFVTLIAPDSLKALNRER